MGASKKKKNLDKKRACLRAIERNRKRASLRQLKPLTGKLKNSEHLTEDYASRWPLCG